MLIRIHLNDNEFGCMHEIIIYNTVTTNKHELGISMKSNLIYLPTLRNNNTLLTFDKI